MFFKLPLASLVLCALYLGEVHAHGTITAITGANGVNGAGYASLSSMIYNMLLLNAHRYFLALVLLPLLPVMVLHPTPSRFVLLNLFITTSLTLCTARH